MTDISYEVLDLKYAQTLIQKWSSEPGFFVLRTDDAIFYSSHPFYTLSSKQGKAIGKTATGKETFFSEPGFSCLHLLMKELHIPNKNPLFLAGAVGYMGYESARFLTDFSHIPFCTTPEDFYFGFYRHGITLFKNQAFLWWTQEEKWVQNQYASRSTFEYAKKRETENYIVIAEQKFEQYQQSFDQVKNYIIQGDCYQVNLSCRFQFQSFPTSIYNFYQTFASDIGYGALITTPDRFICSFSPEKFVEIKGDTIETEPMKGTAPRIGNNIKDQHAYICLKTCKKNEAELTMIVDLLRHDLRKVCLPGSIQVKHHKTLKAFKHVFQQTSVVTGELATDPITAVISLLPGGSITGAPKIRATEIIAELESYPRDIYTGCIGYFGFNGNAHFNMAIRTAYSNQKMLYYHAGSGIVADSICAAEWEEINWKLRPFSLKSILK